MAWPEFRTSSNYALHLPWNDPDCEIVQIKVPRFLGDSTSSSAGPGEEDIHIYDFVDFYHVHCPGTWGVKWEEIGVLVS